MGEIVSLEISGRNGLIALNRPEKRNAINDEMMHALENRLMEAEADARVRTIIIHGAGSCFSAGIDYAFLTSFISSLHSGGYLIRRVISRLQAIFSRMERIEKPIICAMHGVCIGMGMELCLPADFRVMSSECRLSIPEVEFGLVPDVGGTTRLVRLVGIAHAKEIIMTACEIPAERAHAIGLINRIAKPGRHLEEALGLAEILNSKGPLAVGLAKRILDLGAHMDKSSIMELEGLAQSALVTTKDFQEGIAARLEKRPPNFKAE